MTQRWGRWAATMGGGLSVLGLSALTAPGCGRRRPQTVTVAMKAVAFRPDSIAAAVGDTVVFRNDDPVPHTATSDRRVFDSGAVQPDGAWRWVPAAVGRYPYHCTYHPNMTGVIVVR